MGSEAYKFHIITPDDEEIRVAQELESVISGKKTGEIESLFMELIKRPHLKEAVRAILDEIGKSGEIAISSTEKSLTSQVAANFLGVSRPHLNKLLDNGIIPFHKTGSHRRVYFRDILEYRKKRDTMSKGLDALAKEAQENNL